MKNSKGFTLIELLAMLTVIGILMGITIPNVTGILKKSKENSFIDDANKMVEAAKIKIATHKTGYEKLPQISNGQCLVLSLDYINDNEDIGKGPNDGTYLENDSYVVYKRTTNQYKYYVRLVEEKSGDKYSGIDLVDYQTLEKSGYKIKSLRSDAVNKVTKTSNAISVLSVVNSLGAGCSSVVLYK